MTKPQFTARTPVDLIALVPLVLGFHAEDSIVVLSFGGRHPFHVRIDMPVLDSDRAIVIDTLLEPVQRHQIESVAVLFFTTDIFAAGECASELAHALEDGGTRVIDMIRVDDDHYDHPLAPDLAATPYDISAHPFAAEAVLLGRRTLPNRAALADQLIGGDPTVIDEVRAAAIRHAGHRPDRETDERWLAGTLPVMCGQAEIPAEVLGRVLLLISEGDLRDVVLSAVTSETAEALEDLWVRAVRVAPEEFVSSAAAVLAFTAWQSGHGALAWCAVERSLAADPDHSLAQLIARCLQDAIPPSVIRGAGWSAGAA